jgi:hypothetical protein
MWYRMLACVAVTALPGPSLMGQTTCPVQGVWSLESVSVDGAPQPMGQRRQIKTVTARHYAWVGQEVDRSAPRTVADSVAAFRTSGFGAGTYRVADSTYTERIEYFVAPEYLGREVTFSCRVVGDRWYHSADFPVIRDGREAGRFRLEEVWRRIE